MNHIGIGLMVFLTSFVANAEWSSGGGHLLTSRVNPWFVQNTKIVTYCIDIDHANFGTTEREADNAFTHAVSYWQREFQFADRAEKISGSSEDDSHPFELATQRFVKGSCTQDVDLVLLLGKLDEEKQAYLINPKKIVAETVVSSYDGQNLRAKGFIYVSPESGRLGLAFGDLQPGRWSAKSGKRLQMLFIHELGHLFGIKHTEGLGIMGRHFPMLLVSNDFPFAHTKRIPSYFLGELKESRNENISYIFPASDESAALTDFFKANFQVNYLKFEKGAKQTRLLGSETWDGEYHNLVQDANYAAHYKLDSTLVADFHLPTEQTVFETSGDFVGLFERPYEEGHKIEFRLTSDIAQKVNLRIELSDIWGMTLMLPTQPKPIRLNANLYQSSQDPTAEVKAKEIDLVRSVSRMIR